MPNQQEVVEAYRNHHSWMIEADLENLQETLVPDFYLRHMSGLQQPKQVWLQEIATGGMNYLASKEENIKVTVTGDTAHLIGQNRVEAIIHGSQGIWPLQLEMELQKVSGKWLINYAIASMY